MRSSATPRWATERTTSRATFGPSVVEVAGILGFDALPWTVAGMEVALEHDAAGQLAYRDVVWTVPRQAANTTSELFLIVWRMLAMPGQRCAFGMQNRLAAKHKLLDDFWPIVSRSKLGPMFSVTRATGSESLRCSNGSILSILSSEESAGHGGSLDLAILDEAWAMEATTEQAVRPSLITKVNGQLWITSTQGTARSVWWNAKVDAGRLAVESGTDKGLAFLEYSAPPDADPASPATWWATHPALGYTITEETFAADFKAMTLKEFRRSHLNQRADDLADAGWNVIPRNIWQQAANW